MKSIDWQKGFFRLTLIVSIFLGLLGILVSLFFAGGAFAAGAFAWGAACLALGGIIPFGSVWLVYFVIAFIMKGFAGKD